jgi:tight adherence protein C
MLLLLGALLLFAPLPIFVWSKNQTGANAKGAVGADMLRTNRPIDLREAALAQSARERAIAPAIAKITGKLKKITPAGWVDALEQRLAVSGLGSEWTIERVMILKMILTVLGVAFSYWWYKGHGISGTKNLALVLGAPALFFMAPDIYVKNKAEHRQQIIQRELADVLDQITVGVEAGLGFDAAMARSAKSNDGPLAEELTRTLQHVAAGLSRAEALRGLAQRNRGITELRQFVGAILQAEQFGIPMAQVLRVQSSDMRRRRRQRAEEKAMKLPVKILFPLILCILPSLFVVLIGPAGLNMKNKL